MIPRVRLHHIAGRLDRLSRRMLAYSITTGQRATPPTDAEVVAELNDVIEALAQIRDTITEETGP